MVINTRAISNKVILMVMENTLMLKEAIMKASGSTGKKRVKENFLF